MARGIIRVGSSYSVYKILICEHSTACSSHCKFRNTRGPSFCVVLSVCAPCKASAAPSQLFLPLPPPRSSGPAPTPRTAPSAHSLAPLLSLRLPPLLTSPYARGHPNQPSVELQLDKLSPAVLALPHEGPAPLAVPSFLSPFPESFD